MSDELTERLRKYREPLDTAIADDRARSRTSVAPSRPPRRALMVAAALVVVAIGLGVLFVARDGRSNRVSAPTPTTPATPVPSTAPIVDWSWLAARGGDAASAVDSGGWTVMDFADFRFAVPPGWDVPIAASCAQPADGLVLVPPADASSCEPASALPESTLIFRRRLMRMEPGDTMTVGALTAVVAPPCPDCVNVYQFENGYDVSATGPDANRILATLSDSGARRALADGPMSLTDGWQTVTYGGVQFDVPASWPIVDLPATLFTTTDPSGQVIGGGGQIDPGTCGGALFPTPQVFTGRSGLVPSCVPILSRTLEPHDGVWVRLPDDDAAADLPALASGEVGGLDVSLLAADEEALGSTAAPVVLRVSTGDRTILITLGVGIDATSARTILRSLRASSR